MNSPQSITSLPLSPVLERRKRMINYTVAMSIRTVCVIIGLFMQGWWLLIFVLAAMILPYFAVVLANTVISGQGATVERPGVLVPLALPRPSDNSAGES
ncbi:MAG: DUF3099 domain-containing protein [Microbacteriaceae bacterium]